MKIKIKHILMMLLCISVSSMMLVSCSDDDERDGPGCYQLMSVHRHGGDTYLDFGS